MTTQLAAESPAETKFASREWWNAKPMTYGSVHGLTDGLELGSAEFFRRSDAVFQEQAAFASRCGVLLGDLVDYAAWKDKTVLEIGCGMGAVAQRFAESGARLTAVDQTATAAAQTRARFRLAGLGGARALRADAERLPLPADRFEAVFSWGVLHHTPDTAGAVAEVLRVLKPGGEAMVMLYHRNSLRWWLDKWFWEGAVHLENRFLDRQGLTSRYSDGWEDEGNPHTKAYTRSEARELFAGFEDVRVEVCGNLSVSTRHYLPVLWKRVPDWLDRAWSRRVGWFLWIRAKKPLEAAASERKAV